MTETDLLGKAAEQVPNLAVLAFIVWLFLKHLKTANSMIRELMRENTTAREQSRIVIEDNTRAVAQNTEALHEISDVVARLRQGSA